MQSLRQEQFQRQRSPTERFVDLIADAFGAWGLSLSDEMRVRLEDAFCEAVEERVHQRDVDARREHW